MGRDIRILYVEDDLDFAEATANFLEYQENRFSVTIATSVGEGRDRLAEGGFDCVVSDYEMPAQDGLAFLEDVRGEHPDLPFILFTGTGNEEVASDAISAGVTDYFRKDSSTEQYEILSNRIKTAVGQYRAERELERQNDLFAKAQDIANVGAWEYNVTTEEFYVSDEVLRIHGLFPDEELTAEVSLEYYHPEDRGEVRDAFHAALTGGTSYDLEARLIDDNGRHRWVRTRGEAQTEDGKIVRLRGTIQDITAQKRREKTLEQQNERLEEFARIISHDIRNPLQIASGHLELAAETCDESDFRTVDDALDRIDTIIGNVLTLARHGQSVIDTETVRIGDVAAAAWANVDTKNMTLETFGDREIEASEGRLQQLLENLFRNAVEHAGLGSTITVGPIDPMITSTRANADKSYGGFFVADDGPGIPEDDRSEVFETGFSCGGGNTGLGLAIVAQIAKAHGWQPVATESRDGGARFEFTV